jgi:transposase
MNDKPTVYGVDVSKATQVVAQYGVQEVVLIENRPEAMVRWLRGLRRGSIVAMEATGAHHRALAALAHATGMQVFVFNPQTLKHYAKGIGQRGKTDPIDAHMIARYAMHEQPKLVAWEPPTPETDALLQLLQRRDRLVKAKQMLSQSLSGMPALKAERRAVTANLQRMIDRLELLMRVQLAKQPPLAQLHRRLCTIVGVGFVVGTELVACLTRFRFKGVEAFIAYTGLDPRPNNSGQHRGRRILSKHGPALLRKLLYIAGMAAAKSKLFKPLYQSLLARAFKTTEAIIILGRKIARIAFALYRFGGVFNAEKHLKVA